MREHIIAEAIECITLEIRAIELIIFGNVAQDLMNAGQYEAGLEIFHNAVAKRGRTYRALRFLEAKMVSSKHVVSVFNDMTEEAVECALKAKLMCLVDAPKLYEYSANLLRLTTSLEEIATER